MEKKGLAVAVILLFIGVAFTSSINAGVSKTSIDDEFVELEVEFCGLGQKQTIKLTQQELDEVEALFDGLQNDMKSVETREETVDLFNEAIEELNEYGILGNFGLRYTQPMISNYGKSRNAYLGDMSNDENYNCLIAGRTTYTSSLGLLFRMVYELSYDFQELLPLMILMFVFSFFFTSTFIPFKLLSSLTIGHNYWEFEGQGDSNPSVGKISTFGLNGLQNWEGKLKGNTSVISIGVGLSTDTYFIGVEGFTGIKIGSIITGTALFIGVARHVDVDYWNI